MESSDIEETLGKSENISKTINWYFYASWFIDKTDKLEIDWKVDRHMGRLTDIDRLIDRLIYI